MALSHLCHEGSVIGKQWIVLGAVRIEIESRVVDHPEGTRRLSPLELQLLLYLRDASPRIVAQGELLEKVWGYHKDSSSRAALMTLARLRKKIELDPAQPEFLVTVYGQGVRLRMVGATPNAGHEPKREKPSWQALDFGEEASPLLGRDNALAQCIRWSAHGRWLTLSGPGGAGKTRLAKEFALHLNEKGDHADGVIFFSMVGIERLDDVIPALLSQLHIEQVSGRSPLSEAIRVFKNRHCVLILDNAEHLLGLVEPLESLLYACPRVSLVVTSRRVLGSVLENQLPLGGLESPEASLAVFHSHLRYFERGSKVESPPADEILDLLGRLNYHPLSIRLSAAICASHGGSLSTLDKGLIGSIPRQTSSRQLNLRAVFEDTWQALSERSQVALAKLSLLYSPFDDDIAEGALGIEAAVLGDLRLWGLLESHPNGYTLHPMSRALAKEKLEAMPGLNSLERKVQAFFISRLAAWRPYLFGPREVELLEKIEGSQSDFRRALRRPIPDSHHPQGARALSGYVEYLRSGGRYYDIEVLCHQIERRYKKGALFEEAVFLHCVTLEAVLDYRKGWELLNRIQGCLDQRVSQLKALLDARQGRIEESLGQLGSLEPPASLPEEIEHHQTISAIHVDAGQHELALEHHREAFRLSRELGSGLLLARASHGLGTCLYNMGANDEARQVFLVGARALEGRPWNRTYLALQVGLGNTHRLDMNYERSITHYELAERVSTAVSIDQFRLYVFLNLSYAHRELGDLATAESYCHRGLALCESLSERRERFELLLALGNIAHMRGQREAAKGYFRQCMDLSQGRYPSDLTLAQCNLSLVCVQYHDYEEAIEVAERAFSREGEDLLMPHRVVLTIWLECARLLSGGPGSPEGIGRLRSALEEALERGSASIKALCLLAMCLLFKETKRTLATRAAAALPNFQTYARIKAELGVEPEPAHSLDMMLEEIVKEWESLLPRDLALGERPSEEP